MWVLLHERHYQIVVPSQRMQLLAMPGIPQHFVVAPHGELMFAFLNILLMKEK
jgi:hypothetical protein